MSQRRRRSSSPLFVNEILLLGSPSPDFISDSLETSPTAPGKRSQGKARMAQPTFTKADEMVTFVIGPEVQAEKFIVHKEFACHYSSVLKAAFNSKFIEGQTQTYHMTDLTPGAFRMFVQWLYTQKITVNQLLPSTEQNSADNCVEDQQLAELWVLAEKLLIPSLQNAAIEAITIAGNKFAAVPTNSFRYIYSRTHGRHSPLRRLIIAQCLQFLKPEAILYLNVFPKEMLKELTYQMFKKASKSRNVKVVARDFFVSIE